MHSSPPQVRAALGSPGRPLEPSLRAALETRLGHDFASVRVHADEAGAEAAAAVGARAFASGEHVVFGAGRHAPHTSAGRSLLDHELAHVVGQRRRRPTHPVLQRMPDRIVAMTVDLGSATIAVSFDDETTLRGRVTQVNLEPGHYTARWDRSAGSLAIEPWPTREQVIHFQVAGPGKFLRRYVALRQAIATPIPFDVLPAQSQQEPVEPGASDEQTVADPAASHEPTMVFPLRLPRGLWRLDVAPITARREGEHIVVSQPVNAVYANEMFAREVRTLPLSTFLGGVRLRPEQLVRVRLYDDDERLITIRAEDMLRLSEATDTALLVSALSTAVDAASFVVPVGRVVQPLLRTTRSVTAAAMIGTAEAAPVLAGRAAAPALIERAAVPALVESAERAVVAEGAAATSRALTAAAREATVEGAVQAGTRGASSRLGTATTGNLVVRGATTATSAAGSHAGTAVAGNRALQPIAGATEVQASQAAYEAALSRAFPGLMDQIAVAVEGIGDRAARRAVANPQFLAAVQSRNWTLAGTHFHSAAAIETRALPASALPAGWKIESEFVIQAGAGGSRADVYLVGPNEQQILFDWKTSGRSALSASARRQMQRHAGQLTTNFGGTVVTQESRSWIDYVRPLLPGVRWP